MSTPNAALRVGVYIDGFNLYYGSRDLMGGRGVPGWKWLDLRTLAENLTVQQSGWTNAQVARVVYCTARTDGSSKPSGPADQEVYLRALQDAHAVDEIALGYYVNRVTYAPLATKDRRGRPILTSAGWPVQVNDANGQQVPGARFMVSARAARRRVPT